MLLTGQEKVTSFYHRKGEIRMDPGTMLFEVRIPKPNGRGGGREVCPEGRKPALPDSYRVERPALALAFSWWLTMKALSMFCATE